MALLVASCPWRTIQFPGTESLRTIAAGGAPRQLQYSLMVDPSPTDAAKVSNVLFGQN